MVDPPAHQALRSLAPAYGHPMEDDTRWRVREVVELVELDDGFSVFDPTTGRVAFLNRTASDVLSLADGGTSVVEIATALALAYGVAADDILDDIRSALESLRSAGAIERG